MELFANRHQDMYHVQIRWSRYLMNQLNPRCEPMCLLKPCYLGARSKPYSTTMKSGLLVCKLQLQLHPTKHLTAWRPTRKDKIKSNPPPPGWIEITRKGRTLAVDPEVPNYSQNVRASVPRKEIRLLDPQSSSPERSPV